MGVMSYNRITTHSDSGTKLQQAAIKFNGLLKARKHQCERLAAAAVLGLKFCNVEVFERQRCDAKKSLFFFLLLLLLIWFNKESQKIC